MHNKLYVQLCANNGEGIRIRRTEINVVLGRVGNGLNRVFLLCGLLTDWLWSGCFGILLRLRTLGLAGIGSSRFRMKRLRLSIRE